MWGDMRGGHVGGMHVPWHVCVGLACESMCVPWHVGGHTCAMAFVWKSENSLQELALSLYHVGSGFHI